MKGLDELIDESIEKRNSQIDEVFEEMSKDFGRKAAILMIVFPIVLATVLGVLWLIL